MAARKSNPRNSMVALEWLQLGGIAMGVLALMSVLAVTLVIIKLWEFSEWKIGEKGLPESLLSAWERDDDRALEAELSNTPGLLAELTAKAINLLRLAQLSQAQSRERIERLANEALENSRRHLRALELIGSLAPLVGLLGTVVGMIDAFQALQAAGDRIEPAVLSGGIWKALLTTAAGLTVAIPVIAVVHYLEQRVTSFQSALETSLTRLLTRPGVG